MKYDTTGNYRSINEAGRVTINRLASDRGASRYVLSAEELAKRFKTGKFRISQFQDAVRNLEALQRTPAPVQYEYVDRVVRERVAVRNDVVRLG